MGKRVEMYPYSYVYRGRKTVLVWQSSKYGDSFKLTPTGKLLTAGSEAHMRRNLGKESKQVVWSEGATLDFDRFWIALRNLRVGRASSKKTCDLLLDGWNFLEDLLRTTNSKAELRKLRKPVLNNAYDKLFYGNNLPSVTPKGKSYSPLWTATEKSALRNEIDVVWQYLRRKGFIMP